MDDGGVDGELESARNLFGTLHDMVVLGYYGNLYSEKYLNKEPRSIPEQSWIEWVNEQLINRKRCYKMFRMYPDVHEQLHTLLGGPQSFRQVENYFSRSTETIQRKFHMVLNCLYKLGKDNIKPIDRSFTDVHPRLQDAHFWPHFKDSIGAIDGSHIPIEVPTVEEVNHTGRRG
jgi:hypothetical protein